MAGTYWPFPTLPNIDKLDGIVFARLIVCRQYLTMIRITTFAILAVVVALGLDLFITSPGGNPSVTHYACLLVAWLGIFAVCDRGRFSSYLGTVDEEAKQIAWPNDLQVRHNAKIVVFLMTVLVVASYCIDTLIKYLLDISR